MENKIRNKFRSKEERDKRILEFKLKQIEAIENRRKREDALVASKKELEAELNKIKKGLAEDANKGE